MTTKSAELMDDQVRHCLVSNAHREDTNMLRISYIYNTDSDVLASKFIAHLVLSHKAEIKERVSSSGRP